MVDEPLNAQSARMKALRYAPLTSENRAEAEQGLRSKFEGVSVLAAQALAQWGDSASKALLRDWLLENLKRRHAWSVVGEACKALSSLVTPEDARWLLDAYFQAKDHSYRFSLLNLLERLPYEVLSARIKAEQENPDRERQLAAMALVNRFKSHSEP